MLSFNSCDLLTYYILPVGGINRGMKAYGWRYLRARAEISADKSGDILPQSCAMDRQIKCILLIIPPTGYILIRCILFRWIVRSYSISFKRECAWEPMSKVAFLCRRGSTYVRCRPVWFVWIFCTTGAFLNRQNSMVHHFRKNTEQFLA